MEKNELYDFLLDCLRNKRVERESWERVRQECEVAGIDVRLGDCPGCYYDAAVLLARHYGVHEERESIATATEGVAFVGTPTEVGGVRFDSHTAERWREWLKATWPELYRNLYTEGGAL